MADKAGQGTGSVIRLLGVAVLAAAVSACTSSTPPLGLDSVTLVDSSVTLAATEIEFDEKGDPLLPDEVAQAPVQRPEIVVAEGSSEEADETVATAESGEESAADTTEIASSSDDNAENVDADETVIASNEPAATGNGTEKTEPSGELADSGGVEKLVEPDDARPAQNPKRGFFASLFDGSKTPSAPVAGNFVNAREGITAYAAQPKPRKRVITAGPSATGRPKVTLASLSGSETLPGVRERNLFEITRRSGLDDDSDIDGYEADRPIQLASAAGLARLAPNGLMRQHSGVDVKCLKPSLVRVLKVVERRFGKRVVVTSGYRSPRHNRRVRGARNSLHMYCAAADIQVEGVSKWVLAKYLRTMPGRGGVGTYCHTNSVHIDVGPERDWNWRCRRRRKRT